MHLPCCEALQLPSVGLLHNNLHPLSGRHWGHRVRSSRPQRALLRRLPVAATIWVPVRRAEPRKRVGLRRAGGNLQPFLVSGDIGSIRISVSLAQLLVRVTASVVAALVSSCGSC
jgi:hypothetical protein